MGKAVGMGSAEGMGKSQRVLGAGGWLGAGTGGYLVALGACLALGAGLGAVWWSWGLGWGPGGMGVPYAQGKGHLEAGRLQGMVEGGRAARGSG